MSDGFHASATTAAIRVVLAVIAIAGAACYLAAELHTGALGFPLDDAWIHARFASNLAGGHGVSFNPGEPSTGATAPLWTWVWAAALALGAPIVGAGKALGVACAVATAWLAFALTRRLSGSPAAGFVAGAAVALSPRLTWGALAGMETPLYTALVAATLLAFADARRGAWLWGLLAGLSALARPETAVLFPVLSVVALLTARDRALALRRVALAGTAFGLLVGADVALNLWLSGRPLPATFYAKTEGAGLLNALGRLDLAEVRRSLTGRPIDALNQVIRYAFEQSAFLFLFALPGVLALVGALRPAAPPGSTDVADPPAPAGLALVGVLIGAPLAMAAFAPVSPLLMQEGRYVAHLLVAFFCVAAVGVAALAQRASRPWIVWSVAGVALVRLLAQDLAFAPRFASQVDNINRLHVAMGRWLAAHAPPDALIATNDIGALAFFSDRRVLDLEGLTTPAILPFRAGRCHLDYLRERQPALVVIFDEWYPHLAARTDLFEEVHRITVPRVTAAHDTLKVYRPAWARAVDEPRCLASSAAAPATSPR